VTKQAPKVEQPAQDEEPIKTEVPVAKPIDNAASQ